LGLPSSIFEEKIDLCKKGDEITPFGGIDPDPDPSIIKQK
jgi:hypothetical protein